nr:tigger transposable element-derived protein 1 [Cavia porcellus]
MITAIKMAPRKLEKKLRKEGKVKKAITIEKKKEIVEKYESGIRVTDLANMYSMSKSTISTILQRKDLYKEASVAKGVTQISKSRPTVLDEVERLLLVWINERQAAGCNLSESIICEKARALNADLVKDNPSVSDNGKTFRASKGWFHNFKARTGVQSITRYGKAGRAGKRTAETYVHHFGKMTQRSGFCSHQVFNCDESGLFWKKMPQRAYLGLQLDSGDVKEPEEEHSEESSTRELQLLLTEQQRMAAEELSQEEKCQQLVQSSSEIKEVLKKWTELQTFIVKTHPDRENASHCIHLLNDKVMSYYRTVLKKREKQTALDQLLILKRLRPSDPEAGPSELQTLPRRARTPESQIPAVLVEGDSPSKQ